MGNLRIGIVSYSNVAPLAAALPAEQVRRGLPREVGAWLAGGEVDVGLVPTIELGRQPGLCPLPAWGIAANGECRSVFLYGRVPLSEVRSVALDAASRTAAALTRVLLERESARDVEFVERDAGSVAERLEGVDAALLIGDPALAAEPPGDVTTWDLSAEWKRHVGLPFVFACWAARAGLDLGDDDRALFDRAAEEGLARLDELAAAEAERTGIPADRMEVYLRGLDYRLTEAHRSGLGAFLDEAHRVGALPERAALRFNERARA